MERWKKILANIGKISYFSVIPYIFGKAIVDSYYMYGITDDLIYGIGVCGIVYFAGLVLICVRWKSWS